MSDRAARYVRDGKKTKVPLTVPGSRAPKKLISLQVHLVGKPAVSFKATKSLIERTLKPSGFTWEDVVNVYPAQSFVADNSKNRLLDTTRHHVPCVAKKENSLQVSSSIVAHIKV